ncbi:MAG: autotransporter assembly complex family protein [Sulfuricellaceae bacterium]
MKLSHIFRRHAACRFRLSKPALLLALMCFHGQYAFAADAVEGGQEAFRYEVELQAPQEQRKLMEEHLDVYRWRDNERVNAAQLQQLVRLAPEQIRGFLATLGFYAPRIEANLEQRDGKPLVRLVIDPGEPVRVSGMDLQVVGDFNDGSTENRARLEKMRADWGLHPGAVFRHEDWEAAKRAALQALLFERYPAARLADSRATVNPETGGVELLVTLDSGPAFTFGALEIQGLRRYPDSLVKRMNTIAPDEAYSQSKLLELQSRLQDSPYFAGVSVEVDANPKQPTQAPVRVEISENPSQKLGFGIGASTDAGARGQVDYRDLNFLDSAWILSGAFKLEQKRQSVSGDLQFPPTETGFRDSLNALIERTDIEGEVAEKMSLGAKRSIVSGKMEHAFGLRYLVENQGVAEAGGEHRAALSPSYSWTLRDVDHLLYPTHGYLVNLQADVAGRALLSDQDFVRGYGHAVFFYPLGRQDQLIVRGELGMVAASSRSGIPSDFLFRTGGDQTIRGYAFQSRGVQQGSAIVGGRYLALGSAEYVHWLTPKWGSAVFVDGGNAVDSLDGLTPVYGYGAGARWKSPVGPLNLDIAYGQEVREARVHFSVGFNF